MVCASSSCAHCLLICQGFGRNQWEITCAFKLWVELGWAPNGTWLGQGKRSQHGDPGDGSGGFFPRRLSVYKFSMCREVKTSGPAHVPTVNLPFFNGQGTHRCCRIPIFSSRSTRKSHFRRKTRRKLAHVGPGVQPKTVDFAPCQV